MFCLMKGMLYSLIRNSKFSIFDFNINNTITQLPY
jgi:hypothetical protein